MQLYRAVFASTFGRGRHAFPTGLRRMELLVTAALAAGVALMLLLPPLPHMVIRLPSLFFYGLFVMQFAVLLILGMTYGLVRPEPGDVLSRLLTSWPLQSEKIWLALLLPAGILSLISICLVAPSLITLLYGLGLPWWLGSVSVLCGTLSALGLVQGLPRPKTLQGLIILAILASEYGLLRLSVSESNLVIPMCTGWIILLAISFGLLMRSRFSLAAEAKICPAVRRVRLRNSPISWWFVKKFCRNEVTCLGLIVTLLVSVLFAVASYHWQISDSGLAGSILSLLAAALASDSRLILRRWRPAEIAGLRGVGYYLCHQIATTAGLCLASTAPIIVGICLNDPLLTSDKFFIDVGLPLALGIASGLFASTLLAPGPRDITAQTMATLVASGIFILPQLSIFSQLTDNLLLTIKLTLTAMLYGAVVLVEYKRNPFIWRKVHHVNQ